MKLKQVLLEDKEIEALSYILREGSYYGVQPNRRFFRGESDEIKTFKLKRIRKNREPKDTPRVVDNIVEGVRKRHYSKIPSRKRSKFATGKEYVAESYGDVYYTFPPKSANCWWSEQDAWTDHFQFAKSSLEGLEKSYKKNVLKAGLEDIKDLEEYYKFAEALLANDVGKIANLAAQNYRKYLSIYDFFKSGGFDYDDERVDSPNISAFLYNFEVAFEKIKDYFEGIKPYNGDVETSKVQELTIEGSHYIVANKEWFNRNMEHRL